MLKLSNSPWQWYKYYLIYEGKGHNLYIYRTSVALMPRDSMRQSKVAVIQRLRDMNSQFTAIDQMSRNIESDFHNTRLVSSNKC